MSIYYVDASRPDDSGNGLTTATAKKTFEAALVLITNGDSILFITSDIQHTPTLYRTFTQSDITIGAYSPQYPPVISLSLLPRWLTLNSVNVLMENLVIEGSIAGSSNRAIEIITCVAPRLRNMVFKNNFKHFYAYNTSNLLIDTCEFLGCSNTGSAANDFEIYNCGASDGEAAILNNIIHAPSSENLALNMYIRGATHHTKLSNSVIVGSRGIGFSVLDSTHTLTTRNAISFGHGLDNNNPPGTCFSGDGAASTIDNCALGGFTSAAAKIDTRFSIKNPNGVEGIPLIRKYPRQGFLYLTIDDVGAYEPAQGYLGIYELIPILAEYGVKITWEVSAYAVPVLNSLKTAMKAWLDAGHEIGSHGYSHSRTTLTIAMSVIKSGETITISMNRPDTDDMATWSGVVTVSGQVPINITSSTSMGWLSTALTAAGCTVGAFDSQFGGTDIPAIVLDNVTAQSITSAFNLPLHIDSFIHVEVKESKRALEAAIHDFPGYSEYSVVSYGSPYTYSNNVTANKLKDSGYMSGRSVSTDLVTASTHSLDSSIKCSSYINKDLSMGNLSQTGLEPAEEERVNGVFSTLCAGGSVAGFFFHKSTFVEANFRALMDMVMLFKNAGLMVGTQSEIWGWIKTNGVATFGDGTGAAERWHVINNVIPDYHLQPTSPCIGAGVSIPAIHEQVAPATDLDGKTIHFLPPSIGPYGQGDIKIITSNLITTGYSVRGTAASPAKIKLAEHDLSVDLSGLTDAAPYIEVKAGSKRVAGFVGKGVNTYVKGSGGSSDGIFGSNFG